MKQDKFLIGIIAGILVLVAIALTVFFTRQGSVQNYQSEDTPRGVVFNYILALHNGDFDKAYQYLSVIPGKPTLSQFKQTMALNSPQYKTNAVDVTDETITNQSAMVTVVTLMSGGGLFNEGYRNNENATLEKVNGEWRILSMPYTYWSYDWNQPGIK